MIKLIKVPIKFLRVIRFIKFLIISIIIYIIYFAYFAYRAAMGMPIFCLYFACVAYYTRRQNMQNHFQPCLNQNPGK